MKKVKISIGDWSKDGHGKYDIFVFNTNKAVKEIQEAYLKSQKLLRLRFNSNEKIDGIDVGHPEWDVRGVCENYGDYHLNDFNKKILEDHGINIPDSYLDWMSEEEFVSLMIDVIKISLPDLEMEEASYKRSELDSIKPINAWWCDLNVGWGYGLYNI